MRDPARPRSELDYRASILLAEFHRGVAETQKISGGSEPTIGVAIPLRQFCASLHLRCKSCPCLAVELESRSRLLLAQRRTQHRIRRRHPATTLRRRVGDI